MDRNRSIARELIAFSMPLILSGVLQQLYSWADAFIVGRAGEQGEMMLAAVGATGSITMLLINAIVGFTLGLSILAAQAYGRKDHDTLGGILRVFLPRLLVVCVALSAAVILLIDPILHVMDTPKELLVFARDYLGIVLVGVPLLAVYNLFAALLRAVGNTKVAFYAVLLSSVLNVVLDVLLVWVWPYGVKGAAAATVVSQVCMTVFVLWYARTYYGALLWGEKGADTKALQKQGVAFGMPPTIQNSVTACGNLVLQSFMNSFGALTVLGITTAYRVDCIMLLPIINLGAAVSSMTARAKGAGDRVRIRGILRSGLGLMVVTSFALGLVMRWFGANFVALFGVTGEALETGRLFFRDLSWFYVFFGVSAVLRGALEGIGDITYCSAVGIISLGVRIAFSYILRPLCGRRAIAFAECVAWSVMLLMLVVRGWLKRRELGAKTNKTAENQQSV